jgi:osmotically-inducible protein OsmY
MKSNAELQPDVQDAIKWQPLLNAAEIGVTATDGVVSLTGVVDNYARKTQAEDAAKNVAGVTALVEKIEVTYPNTCSKTNAEIATEVLSALKARWDVPAGKVKVAGHRATLTGTVDSLHEKKKAGRIAWNAPGVWAVDNELVVDWN